MKLLSLVLLLAPMAAVQTSASQGNSATAQTSQTRLLQTIRGRYDLPWQHGLGSFSCQVGFNWTEHLTQTLHRPIPEGEPTVRALGAVKTTLSVDQAAGPRVSSTFTDPQPAPGSTAAGLQKSLANITRSAIEAWMNFSTGSMLPVGQTNYMILPTDQGYRIDLTGEGIASTMDLDRSDAMTQSTSRIPGQTLRYDTTFVPAAAGLELSHVRTVTTTTDTGSTALGSPVSDTTFDFTYQAIDGVSIPATLKVQARGGSLWNITLSGCSVRRSSTP
jgi:hypothetical protein